MSIIIGVISWGGQNLPMDLNQWEGLPNILKLARAICANAWAHRDRLLGSGRRYGDQNSLRMSVAEILEELSLVPYVHPRSVREPDIDLTIAFRESNEGITRKPQNIPEDERERVCADVRATKVESRRLAFFCWIHGSPPSDLNRAFFGREDHAVPPGLSDRLLREVVDSFELESSAGSIQAVVALQAAFVQQEIVNTYGAQKFYERVNASLRESPLGRLLASLLRSFGELAEFPALRSGLMESGTFLAVREAADREALMGRSDYAYDHWLVLRETLGIYRPVHQYIHRVSCF